MKKISMVDLMSIELWFNLLFTSLFISISPGAGAITTMNQSICYGFRKSLYTIAGLQTGWAIQIIIVSFGIGTLIESSTFILSALKWSGVVYLLILGIQQWIHKDDYINLNDTLKSAKFNGNIQFLKAILINLTNIKATLFLILFIPIFITTPNSYNAEQIFIVVCTMVFADTVVMIGFANLSNYIKKYINKDKVQYLHKFSGLALILIGISIAYQINDF